MSPDRSSAADIIEHALRHALAGTDRRPFVLGLCGAQGSGKSTVAEQLRETFAPMIPTAVLSLDDLYLTRNERERLAREVHPLLLTRGVPGTHDVEMGLQVLDDLECGKSTRLPRFDKSTDDRCPPEQWEDAPAGTRLLLFEGWCVGARPQSEDPLAEPINRLERDEDGDGRWRRFVNDALAGVYQQLFGRIDMLVLLKAPSFEVVSRWRGQQEDELRSRTGAGAGVMTQAQVDRFIQHYERLTRHILEEMPRRADLVLSLDSARTIEEVHSRIPGLDPR